MSSLNVYLVGESPSINSQLADKLEQLACVNVVATAVDETSAMLWLARRPDSIDLVIVDLFLKAGSGLGVLRRSRLTHPCHRIVVLSNFARGDLRRSCISLGAAQVFDKTSEIDSLLAYCDDLAVDISFH